MFGTQSTASAISKIPMTTSQAAANVRKNRNRIERPAQHHDTGEDAYHAEEGLSGAPVRVMPTNFANWQSAL